MPRLAFEEPKGGPMKTGEPTDDTAEPTDEKRARHRKGSDGDDHTLVLLKAATVAVAIALVATIVLLTTSGSDEPAAEAPSVPQIGTSGASTGPTTSSPAALVVPPVHTQTAEMTVAPPPPPPPVTQPTVPTGQPPGGGQNQFVRVGEPCDTEGAYAFTERYEPVICDRRRGSGELTWRAMFR